MKPSKSLKHGFTFVELVLAVAIIGICITALFTLQTNLLLRVAQRNDAIRRVLYAKNLLYEYIPTITPEMIGKPQIKTIEEPAMKVTLLVKPLPEKSALHQFDHTYMVSAHAAWERDGIPYDHTLTTFAFIPPPPKEEKKP